MGEWYLGEIRAFAGGYAPNYWLPCSGQTLQINQYSPLYALIGVMYGGDGVTNFQLPNLNGAFVLGAGVDSSTGVNHAVGETTTRTSVSLNNTQLPQHIHAATFQATNTGLTCSVAAADAYVSTGSSPGGNVPARSGASKLASVSAYTTAASENSKLAGVNVTGGTFAGGQVTLAQVGGGGVPLMPPFTAVTYMIAIAGIFPSRS